MPDANDMDLVREFARTNSEAAFTELVRRHINLVYSVARRCTGSDGEAQDVAQAVFIVLARKAGRLRETTPLAGWLYETTRFTAARLVRTNARRHAREQEAYMQSTLNEADSAVAWEKLSPHLETAMGTLPERDRTLLVLRFYEKKTAAETAALLGIREDAAHKRLARSIEKLRKFFVKRGVTLTVTAIAGAVSANSVQAAPVALVKTISSAAVAKSAAGGATALLAAFGGMATKGWFSFIFGYLAILFTPYSKYRIMVDAEPSAQKREYIRGFYRRNILTTLGIFIPYAVALYLIYRDHGQKYPGWDSNVLKWNFREACNFSQGAFFGLIVIYILVTFISVALSRKERSKLFSNLAIQQPADALTGYEYEYRSGISLFGLPLIHVHLGESKEPVKAWIAVGAHAIGGLFAFGEIAVAPLSIGFFSIGLLPLGAMAVGIIPVGGVSVGIWAVGGMAIGWQAVGACAIAWKAACGDMAWAFFGPYFGENKDWRQYIQAHWFFRNALTFSHYWLWTNILWIIPLLIIQRTIAADVRRRREQ